DLPDSGVVSCTLSSFYGLTFPQPEGGIVTVIYPIGFNAPAGDPGTLPPPPVEPGGKVTVAVTTLGSVGHQRVPCGKGADLPLSERLVLWRERLSAGRSVDVALRVYRAALQDCEAS